MKTSGALYGPAGSRAASVRWFQETQTENVAKKTGAGFEEWFHGIITRKEAENLLDGQVVGCFLVRVSESRFGYSLSFRVSGRCRHYMIDQLPNGKFTVIGEAKVHRSLHAMVEYYRKNKLSNWDGLLSVPCGQEDGQCDYSELVDFERVYADLPTDDLPPQPINEYSEPYHPYLDLSQTVGPPPLPDRNYSLERDFRASKALPNTPEEAHSGKPLPGPPEGYERMDQGQNGTARSSPGTEKKTRMSTTRVKLAPPPPALPPRK